MINKFYRKGKKLDNNPDYQRLQRYYAREEKLAAQEKDALRKGDIETLNITRGLLFNVRFQIREMQDRLCFDAE